VVDTDMLRLLAGDRHGRKHLTDDEYRRLIAAADEIDRLTTENADWAKAIVAERAMRDEARAEVERLREELHRAGMKILGFLSEEAGTEF
jgi:hypothetical protein